MASTNNNSSTNKNKTSSAEAMDALNLDDLFNDDPNDPFFDDMDMDLGDISGVFNEGGGDVMLSQEFGRVGSVGGNRTANAPIQSSNRQPVGKKRGSKVALTHAQIMANLGIKKDDEKKTKAVAASPIEKDEGGIVHRIRTRREARSSETDGGVSKSAGVSESNKNNTVQNDVAVDIGTQAVVDAVADYGIKPSVEFYPYIRLPGEVEIKKTQKAFPCLEKIIHASPDKSSITTLENPSPQSQLYQLCATHSSSHNETPAELESALQASTDLAKAVLSQSHPLVPSLKNELSKLLISVMKQSAFLRQNLWNMETYAKKELKEAEFKDTFVVLRKDMEDALTLVRRDGFQSILPSTHKESKPRDSSNIMNLKPLILVKVKLRVQGWRDKSGRKLVGRLNPPKEWKNAAKKAKILALKRQAEEDAAARPKVDPSILKAVAAETLHSHLLIEAKKNKPEITNTAISDMAKAEPQKTKKRPTKKRKSATFSSSNDTDTPLSRIAKKLTPTTPFCDLFHIPSYKPHRSSTFSSDRTASSKNLTTDEQSLIYTKLLHPALSPTERRIMLANEVSSTVQRLESARSNKQTSKAKEMRKEIKELEALHKKDLETMPEVANTVGLWRWIERASYFRDFKEEDVFDAFNCIYVDSLDDRADSNSHGGGMWGSMLPPISVQTKLSNESPDATEESPLFNCLQSLLVEVDGSDDEEYDDDDLLADLPPFTVEQIIHGPHSQNCVQDDEVLDVSKLTLDQRTYLQLRAVGLIDTSNLSGIPTDLVENPMQHIQSHLRTTDLDDVIQNMKSDLSKLETSNSSSALALRRLALMHASQSLKTRKQARDQESILAKYNELKREKTKV